eukprot:2013288-Karenia_brevis.AAC.1
MLDLTRQHARSKPLVGFGECCTGAEVHKLLPDVMAVLLHPLHVKSSLTIRRPLQWKGGQLMNLWKGKASPSLIKNHRDVMLADHDGKVFSSLQRSELMPSVSKLIKRTQMGSGLNCGATDTAHLMSFN